MSLVLPKLARGLLLAGLLGAAPGSADAQSATPRRAPKIYFTEPGAPLTSTNVVHPTNAPATAPKKPVLGVLDRTIRKPFEFFNAEDSFSGVAAPPPPPARPSALNSKRARELLERKRNWVFNTPEDLYGLRTSEEMLNAPEYGPNGEEKKAKTSLERYFERTEKARTDATTNRAKNDSLPAWLKPDDAEEKSSFSNEDKVSDGSLLSFSQAHAKRPSAGTDFLSPQGSGTSTTEKRPSEFFSLGSSDPAGKSAASDALVAGRRQAFKQLLDPRALASPGPGAGLDLRLPGSTAASPLSSPFSAGMLGRDSFSPQPAPRPTSLPSMTPATTLPGSYAAPLSMPPARPVSRAPTPAFELPQRKF